MKLSYFWRNIVLLRFDKWALSCLQSCVKTSQICELCAEMIVKVFNRPSVAGAFLQKPLSQMHSFIHQLLQSSFSLKPSKHHYTQAMKTGAELFREFSPPTTCHMSCVICHVSLVTCHVWGVKCQVSGVTCIFSFFYFLSVRASWWRVCYQWGLPRLVSREWKTKRCSFISEFFLDIFDRRCKSESVWYYEYMLPNYNNNILALYGPWYFFM